MPTVRVGAGPDRSTCGVFEDRSPPPRSETVPESCRAAQRPSDGVLGVRCLAETINGRCCMLGFVAGVGAEAATGETLAGQFYSHPLAFALVVALVTYATFVPSAQVSASPSHP